MASLRDSASATTLRTPGKWHKTRRNRHCTCRRAKAFIMRRIRGQEARRPLKASTHAIESHITTNVDPDATGPHKQAANQTATPSRWAITEFVTSSDNHGP